MIQFPRSGTRLAGRVQLGGGAYDELVQVPDGVVPGGKGGRGGGKGIVAFPQVGVPVGVQKLDAVCTEHSGAVGTAHLPDGVPQVLVAHHPRQHPAAAVPGHGPSQHIVVHAAVNDKGFVHRGRQGLGIGLRRGAPGSGKTAFRQQGAQLFQCVLGAVQADGQGGSLQHPAAHSIQLCAQCRPVGLFQQIAQEVIIAHAGAGFVRSALYIIMGAGTGGSELVALLDEQLLHAQLQLTDHPGIGGFGGSAGKDGVVQPLAADLHRLFQAALQQAQAEGKLRVAGSALLPPCPEIQLGAAVAQPCAAQGVQLLGGMGGGVQLVQHIGEQVQVLQLLRGDSAQIIVEIQVQAAGRGVTQQGGTGQLLGAALRGGIARAKVGGGEGMLQHQFAIGAHRGGILRFRCGGDLHHLHRGGGKQLPQQGVEPALLQLAAQGGEELVGVQQQGGIAGVQPAGGGVDGVQHAVRQAARALQRGKLGLVQSGQQ